MSDAEKSHDETVTLCDQALSQAWDEFDAATAQEQRLWGSLEVRETLKAETPDFWRAYRTIMTIAEWSVVVRGAKLDRLGNDLIAACVRAGEMP